MEQLETCPCCGGNNFQLYLVAKDSYSSESFNLVKCTSCGFVFTNPRPDNQEIGHYYDSPDYISHNSYSKGLVQTIYRFARKYMMRKKLSLIQNITGRQENFSLLDFGCGTGDFLGFVKHHHIIAEGVEPDQHAREIAKSVNHVETYSIEASANIESEKFDVITLWHVLEHVHELHTQLEYFNKWLKKDGMILIAVPNIESYDAKKYGKYWDAIDVPRHIYHFSPKNIKQIATQHNFIFQSQYPLFLDAFYISMRSEWHKGTGKFLSFLNAVFTGFMSNFKARKNLNYSSLIYVFKKG